MAAMGAVYAGADLVIIVAAGNDTATGLPGSASNPRVKTVMVCNTVLKDETFMEGPSSCPSPFAPFRGFRTRPLVDIKKAVTGPEPLSWDACATIVTIYTKRNLTDEEVRLHALARRLSVGNCNTSSTTGVCGSKKLDLKQSWARPFVLNVYKPISLLVR